MAFEQSFPQFYYDTDFLPEICGKGMDNRQ